MKSLKLLTVSLVVFMLFTSSLNAKVNFVKPQKLFSFMNEIENLERKSENVDNLESSEFQRLSSESSEELFKTVQNNNQDSLRESDGMEGNLEGFISVNDGYTSESTDEEENILKRRLFAETGTSLNTETGVETNTGSDSSPGHKKHIRMRHLTFGEEMTKTTVQLKDWLSITSSDYAKMKKYPSAQETFINLNSNYTRINEKYVNKTLSNGVPGPNYFYFRQNLKYIYYYETATSTNILGTIYLDNILNVRDILHNKLCFTIMMKDKEDTTYKLCAKDLATKKKWLCKLQILVGSTPSAVCSGGKDVPDAKIPTGKAFRFKKKILPMILIPMPSGHCNEKWDYKQDGADWQCKCSLNDGGVLQSPINLPTVKKAINTIISPIFEYQRVPTLAMEDSANGKIKEGDTQKIFFHNGALRIYANFGKIVTLDGTGYYAEEINFHTPSEHTINGRRFDMEMKIIHRAKTNGDYGKSLTLSFLFKAKAGAYNKFLDKLDFYNLPNPFDDYQELKEEIFVPNLFMDEDVEGSGEMAPFSFFSYEGSITEPPCTENTIVYVASEPISVSLSTLQLFREALSNPDQIDYQGRVISSPKELTNYRKIMPQKGRAIFHYDKKNDCQSFIKRVKDKGPRGNGHYERRVTHGATYYFVPGEKPSNLPGALVVTDAEARSHLDPEIDM